MYRTTTQTHSSFIIILIPILIFSHLLCEVKSNDEQKQHDFVPHTADHTFLADTSITDHSNDDTSSEIDSHHYNQRCKTSKFDYKEVYSQLYHLPLTNPYKQHFQSDPITTNSLRTVNTSMVLFSYVNPTPYTTPLHLVALNSHVLHLLIPTSNSHFIDDHQNEEDDSEEKCRVERENVTKLLSGNIIPINAEMYAYRYAGHQFGVYVDQLGDGRVLQWGVIPSSSSPSSHVLEINLKGAGITPYSRDGDGRAVRFTPFFIIIIIIITIIIIIINMH